nr:MAG TPA: DNA-binding protein [Caudoviricetes sp.]
MRRNWTTEEVEYLTSAWGNVSVKNITKHLSRSVYSVLNKVNKLKLGTFLSCGERYVTLSYLSEAVYGNQSSGGYIKISWAQNRGLPLHTICRQKEKFEVVYIDEFWEWAYKNQSFLNFSKFEKYYLGVEPDWVDKKRRADIRHSHKFITSPWTAVEDERLKKFLAEHKYSYRELSILLNRTEGAIQRRILDLGIKERPVKANNHIKWTAEEFKKLGEMIKSGYKYEEMSDVLDKSAKAIRGRVFDYYLTERLDKVRAYIGNGQFGDNLPDRTIKYKRFMSDEDKEKVKVLLSMLAGEIKCVAKENSNVESEYADFWQKEYCTHWDSVKGCTANEKDCDSCTSFNRIEPQFCKRCGITFYERKSNDICKDCRAARIKQAQRKYAILNQKGV